MYLPLLPVPPHVGHDVCVEVGVAEVQGEGEEDEEPPEGCEAARPVLRDEGRGVGHMLGRTVQHGEDWAQLSCYNPLQNTNSGQITWKLCFNAQFTKYIHDTSVLYPEQRSQYCK